MGLGNMFKKFIMARQIEMGEGKYTIVGVRQVSASVSTLVSIQKEVIKKMGQEGVKVLYTGGKIGGHELVDRIMKVTGLTGSKMVDLLVTGCTDMMGWGIVSTVRSEKERKHFSFKVVDSPLSTERQKKAFCHIERLKLLNRFAFAQVGTKCFPKKISGVWSTGEGG